MGADSRAVQTTSGEDGERRLAGKLRKVTPSHRYPDVTSPSPTLKPITDLPRSSDGSECWLRGVKPQLAP